MDVIGLMKQMMIIYKKKLMWTYFCIRGDLFMLLVTLDLSDISLFILYILKFSTLSRFTLGDVTETITTTSHSLLALGHLLIK